MLKGVIRAAMPKIKKVLAMLLPIMFPNARSEALFSPAVTFTKNSGADVPNDTMVRPITTCDIPKRKAIDEAPSTNRSAPLINITNPITNAII